MTVLAFAPVTLALWVGSFAVWALWRQVPPIFEYGLWGVTNSTRTVVIALILLALSTLLLRAIRANSHRAEPIFGVLATMVAAPPIFIGVRDNLPVFGYSYYSGFDWIASETVQYAWLALVAVSILHFTLCAQIRERNLKDSDIRRTPSQIWLTTLYWIVTAWFTVLALNALSPFYSKSWIDFYQNLTGDISYRNLFRAENVMVVAIAAALWARSGVAAWLAAVWLVSFHLSDILSPDRWLPTPPALNITRDYWVSHPLVIIGLTVTVFLLNWAKILRKV